MIRDILVSLGYYDEGDKKIFLNILIGHLVIFEVIIFLSIKLIDFIIDSVNNYRGLGDFGAFTLTEHVVFSFERFTFLSRLYDIYTLWLIGMMFGVYILIYLISGTLNLLMATRIKFVDYIVNLLAKFLLFIIMLLIPILFIVSGYFSVNEDIPSQDINFLHINILQ